MATELSRLLGANIRSYRKGLSLTQEKLADLAEMSTPYLNLLESGKKFPSEDKLESLAKALNVRPYQLFVDPLVDRMGEQRVTEALTSEFLRDLGNTVQAFVRNYPKSRSEQVTPPNTK